MPPIISSKRNRCRSSRCYPKTHSSKPEYNITDFAVVTSQREAFIQPERLDELLLNLFLPNVRQASFPSHRCSQFFRLRACLPIIPYFFGGWKPGRNGDEQALAERVDVGFVHFAIVFEFGFGLFSTSHGHTDFCQDGAHSLEFTGLQAIGFAGTIRDIEDLAQVYYRVPCHRECQLGLV